MSNLSANTSSSARPQVFISYSHEPPENADFVRDLAGWLCQTGFVAWLDEERIPAAASIESELKKAIEESDVGLFVVTSRWTKREWTRYEVRLFAERDDNRRLVVLREDVSLGELGPHLGGLKVVNWKPESEKRHEHYWEIYCGITNTPPGPRKDWAHKARNLIGDSQNLDATKINLETPKNAADSSVKAPAKNGFLAGRQLPLPCKGRPIKCVDGEKWTFIVTDNEEWIGISSDGEFHPDLTRLSDHTSAIRGANHELLVGIYEPMIVRLREKHWEYLPQEAPVLCFTTHEGSNIAGTAAGGVVLLDNTSFAPVFRIRDPIIELASFDKGLVILGSRGIFGYATYPVSPGDTLKWINADKLGRPVGLFKSVDYNQVGVYSSTKIGMADPLRGQVNICEHKFEQGIRDIIFLNARSKPYAVLTDDGNLTLVDTGLGGVRPIQFPRESYVKGCYPSRRGEIHVWTDDGYLYAISSDGSIKEIVSDDVALAYHPQSLAKILHVVRYSAKTGASIEQIKLD